MARDLLDLAASAGRLAKAMPDVQRRGVQKAALFVTREIRGEILRATGDNRLSGVGRRGAKVGAKFDIKGTTNPTALITATGPLHLIERDTGAHSIEPRGRTRTATGRRRRGSKALKFRSGEFYASAMHPGTKGKRPFGKGVDKAAPKAPQIFQDEFRGAIRREWGL